jgi:beta-lactamase superfamily II metal-dependent hydrolase
LEPTASSHPKKHAANENMSAFFIPLRGGGFYLSAGDATKKDELRIGSWAQGEIAAHLRSSEFESETHPRILKLSHHGSKTSSNPLFIDAIHPTEAWISVGVGNRYGHPAPSVLEEIREKSIPLRRTDQSGALEVRATDVRRRR